MIGTSFVYVISDADGPSKVGISTDPHKRVRQLQASAPRRLRISHSVEAPIATAEAIERYAHWLLREQRINGEWFNVDDITAGKAVDDAREAVRRGDRAPARVAGPGRPSMDLEETKVRLRAGMKARIIALVGKHRMADFIREAVEEKLAAEAAPSRKPNPLPPDTP